MTLSTSALESDIIGQLKTIVTRVYPSAVPQGVSPVYPYAIVFFGSPIRIGTDRHITSTRNDTLNGFCTIRWYAPTDDAARDAQDATRDLLTGYTPTDCGEMVLEGGISGYSGATSDLSPTVYHRDISFSYKTNLTWVV